MLKTTVVLAAYYGLRRSEVIGLKWSAVFHIFLNIDQKKRTALKMFHFQGCLHAKLILFA